MHKTSTWRYTMKKFIDTALAVASREAQIEGLTGSLKETRAAANAVKIEAYADIIAALASVPLTSKGKLPRAVSTDLRDTLLEAGVSKSCTKRYVENSTAAMRVFNIPSQATPDAGRGNPRDRERGQRERPQEGMLQQPRGVGCPSLCREAGGKVQDPLH
jgi:hypothetical protein